MFDPQVDVLSEKTWIPGRMYYEPTFIARVPRPTYSTPYHIANWGMRSTQLVRYEAPAYTFKSNQLYPIKTPARPNIGTVQGAAPVDGKYTGIPSGCTGSGMGGNPYS